MEPTRGRGNLPKTTARMSGSTVLPWRNQLWDHSLPKAIPGAVPSSRPLLGSLSPGPGPPPSAPFAQKMPRVPCPAPCQRQRSESALPCNIYDAAGRDGAQPRAGKVGQELLSSRTPRHRAQAGAENSGRTKAASPRAGRRAGLPAALAQRDGTQPTCCPARPRTGSRRSPRRRQSGTPSEQDAKITASVLGVLRKSKAVTKSGTKIEG